jgi:hypothetical protein
MNKVIYCSILLILFSGCSWGKKPAVVDKCSKAPTICFSTEVGQTPNDIPVCVELMKCYEWIMKAK